MTAVDYELYATSRAGL